MRFSIDALNRLMAGALALVVANRDKDQIIDNLVRENTQLKNENENLRKQLGQAVSDADAGNTAVTDAQNQLDAHTRTADAVETLVQGPELPKAPEVPDAEQAAAVVAGEQPHDAPVTQEVEQGEPVEFVAPADAVDV